MQWVHARLLSPEHHSLLHQTHPNLLTVPTAIFAIIPLYLHRLQRFHDHIISYICTSCVFVIARESPPFLCPCSLIDPLRRGILYMYTSTCLDKMCCDQHVLCEQDKIMTVPSTPSPTPAQRQPEKYTTAVHHHSTSRGGDRHARLPKSG